MGEKCCGRFGACVGDDHHAARGRVRPVVALSDEKEGQGDDGGRHHEDVEQPGEVVPTPIRELAEGNVKQHSNQIVELVQQT